MNETGVSRRSRRRRKTFSFFGRQLDHAGAVELMGHRVWSNEGMTIEAVSGNAFSEPVLPTPATSDRSREELEAVISRLQRDARTDRNLEHIPRPELDRLIASAVQGLWTESRVTAFVPLLAMRRVREELGLPEQTTGPEQYAS